MIFGQIIQPFRVNYSLQCELFAERKYFPARLYLFREHSTPFIYPHLFIGSLVSLFVIFHQYSHQICYCSCMSSSESFTEPLQLRRWRSRGLQLAGSPDPQQCSKSGSAPDPPVPRAWSVSPESRVDGSPILSGSPMSSWFAYVVMIDFQ